MGTAHEDDLYGAHSRCYSAEARPTPRTPRLQHPPTKQPFELLLGRGPVEELDGVGEVGRQELTRGAPPG